MDVLLEKDILVDYIITKYRNEYNTLISTVKLQKGLYFLFTEWIRKKYENQIEDTEFDLSNYSDFLFDDDFSAFMSGPVDKEVFQYRKTIDEEQLNSINIVELETDDIIKEFVDYLLERVFVSNDFALVDMAREDKCWQNARKREDKKILTNEIFEDYKKEVV